MRRAAVIVVLGLVALSCGLYLSPAPWLALAVPGALLIALGLLMEVENDESAQPPPQR